MDMNDLFSNCQQFTNQLIIDWMKWAYAFADNVYVCLSLIFASIDLMSFYIDIMHNNGDENNIIYKWARFSRDQARDCMADCNQIVYSMGIASKSIECI